MPWREVSVMDERLEFVRLAMLEGANRRELCRRFGISPQVGYKWLARGEAGDEDLKDRSRRPLHSPGRSSDALEAAVLAVRDAHPPWGARKIEQVLSQRGMKTAAVSTIHAILQRHDRIGEPVSPGKAYQRFEKEAPNLLWQMDFKGWVRLDDGSVCHPLTVIDDHSRYVPCLKACADQKGSTVKAHLETCMRRYGMPQAFFVDNGNPWSDSQVADHWTRFEVWLLKLGVGLVRSTPYHPQSRGKNERFHRTLKAEVLALRPLKNLDHAQQAFDEWLGVYNHERPHEGIGLQPPSSRYRSSPKSMPEHLPEPEYDEGEIVRTVCSTKPYIRFKSRRFSVPKAFCGERLAIRPLDRDGRFGLFFASHHVADINLTDPKPVSHVPEQVSAMSPD
jgi:putative transposase